MMLDIEQYRGLIEKALRYSGGTHNSDDIIQSVMAGRMQIWPAKNSMAITEIIVYPRKKALHVFLAAGDKAELLDMIDAAREWGRSQGCTIMTTAGRFGWERVLGNVEWKKSMVVLEREI